MPGQPGHPTNEPQNYFALGVQGAKDQDAGTFYFFKHLDGTGFDTTMETSPERTGGDGREIGLNYKNLVHADGAVVAYAHPDCSGRLLTYALGMDTASLVATSAGGPLVCHTIVPGTQLPYLTADQTWADMSERTTNCLVSDLKIEGEAGKPIKYTAQFSSGGSPHAATTALTASRETQNPIMYPGASAFITAFGGSGAGASSIELTKFSVEIKQQLDEGIQTTSLNREDLVWLTSEVSVDGTLKYENNDMWESVIYGGVGGTQVPVGLATGTFTVFAPWAPSGGSQWLKLSAPLVQIGALKVNRLDPDGKTMYYDFTAMTIKNATTSLYAQVMTGATTAYIATAT